LITSPLLYLFVLALMATFLYLLEERSRLKIFSYVPSVVMIYAFAMGLASLGFFAQNDAINHIYSLTKTNLLPAMLFLMLLQIDLKDFAKLGKKLIIAYLLAVVSIAFAFVAVAYIFSFSSEMAAAFGALAGSWMGGTANMIAVGSALGVDESAFAYALIVDSVDYTLWVMLLLFLVPFAKYFDRFSGAVLEENELKVGCACSMGAKRYWLLIALALFVSFVSQVAAEYVTFLNKTTTIVLIASLLGVSASFTKLRFLNGASEVATTMLYLLVALIGSHAHFEDFSGVGVYVLAGLVILAIHAVIMVAGAKLFRLSLFSIAVASLSNIGGVASAPILAAAYNKRLVSVGVLMAVMGYLIGTFGGLFIGHILLNLSAS